MNSTDSYGDKNYDTMKGSVDRIINELKIYQLLF